MTIRVGVAGLGMMGSTHLAVYGNHPGVELVAIADRNEDRLQGRRQATGNIEGQARGGANLDNVKRYTDVAALIADPDVELVDLCLPTPAHRRLGEAVLDAGKHLLIEKPLARTYEDAKALAAKAESAAGLSMVGMCLRFWPGWTWLKEAIDDRRFGKLHSVHFRRLTQLPEGRFYADGDANGGAILDLHIHDADTVRWCLGMPESVSSVGHGSVTEAIDYVVTQYHYPGGPVVTAEGGWSMTPGFGFEMQYTANFERGTAKFDINTTPWLKTLERGGDWQDVDLKPGMGYDHEIAYFLECIEQGRRPDAVTLTDAAESVRLVEAETRSVREGKPIKL